MIPNCMVYLPYQWFYFMSHSACLPRYRLKSRMARPFAGSITVKNQTDLQKETFHARPICVKSGYMTIKKLLLAVFILICVSSLPAMARSMSLFFEEQGNHDPSVPTPASYLGYEVGDWHVRHDQLIGYLSLLAESSDRVQIKTIGYTHERRPLVLLTISAADNLTNLEKIRQQHRSYVFQNGETRDPATMPLVVWLGYSVHGNEPSGSNAALLVAYHLAASRDIDELLEKTVILIDPCLNPDGLSRFSHWVNSNKGKHPVADPAHREHLEAWPAGRTNHYWFDLNRDWLLLQHPESRARIAEYHRWRPNILCDFHEMYTDATYFFQPGIPSRQNPLTPVENLELTRLIARYHARSFNRSRELYFSEQLFDDFYFGKGSSYPDIQGSIGILFEQASSRGHLQERSYNTISFWETIRNHVRTSLSTLEAGLDNRARLLRYQRDFYRKALSEARKDSVRAYVFGTSGETADTARAYEMADILLRHQIEFHRLARPVTQAGVTIEKGFIIPLDQPQYLLIKSLFEQVTEFRESSFYDVSTWHFPHAFRLPYITLDERLLQQAMIGERVQSLEFPKKAFSLPDDPYAFLFEWTPYYAPRAAYRLLQAGVKMRFATQPFLTKTDNGQHAFGSGSILIPMGLQTLDEKQMETVLAEVAGNDGITIHSVGSGLTTEGVDLGSPSFEALEKPQPLMLTGSGVDPYDAGEIWHLLDHRFDIPLVMSDLPRFSTVDLRRYTHLILVDGDYSILPRSDSERIERWVKMGGTLILMGKATTWGVERELVDVRIARNADKPEKDQTQVKRRPYGDRSRVSARKKLSGTIFQGSLDRTHPLGYGIEQERIALFRNHTLFMQPGTDPFATVIQYEANPLLSGYASRENRRAIASSAALMAQGHGKGAIILMMDNPNFRGYWYGTNKLFLNGLFFSSFIENTRK